jgi:hypothetical protein
MCPDSAAGLALPPAPSPPPPNPPRPPLSPPPPPLGGPDDIAAQGRFMLWQYAVQQPGTGAYWGTVSCLAACGPGGIGGCPADQTIGASNYSAFAQLNCSRHNPAPHQVWSSLA